MEILNEMKVEIKKISDEGKLNQFKAAYLSKSDYLVNLQNEIKTASPERRKVIGQEINSFKKTAEEIIEIRRKEIKEEEIERKINNETIDVSLEGNDFNKASSNILLQTIQKVKNIFSNIGYDCQDVRGHEVEDVKYNFDHLNISENHPARNSNDTFYVEDNTILRTHCTNISARLMSEMNKNDTAFRVISYGNVYRKDDDDATHSHQFMQIDGVNLGPDINFSNLKWTLEHLSKQLFGESTTIRLRPSHFPFTEPSVEVDVSCYNCESKGCNICKYSGWIEILGAGMFHPNVIKAAGLDPDKIQGFAFGIGVERLAMIKYKIKDIRYFYNNDIRILKQFTTEEE